MLPRARGWRILLLLSAAILVAGLARYSGDQIDDTFISFRYARNLVDGHGLVFNPGERVEGYTNLLFVLLAAACIGLGIDPLTGTTIVSLVAGLASVGFAARLARGPRPPPGVDPEPGRKRAAAAASLLLVTEGFAYWSVVSLETTLFAALLCAALLLLLREGERQRGHASAFLFILLSLTRPEGVAACGAALAGAAILERRRTGGWRHLPRLAVTAGIAGIGIAALFAWRLGYYGSLLPNTFYAKVTGGEGQLVTGLQYIRDWALAEPVAAAALLAPLVLLRPAARQRLGRGNAVWLAWALVAYFAIANVAVGGDAMPFFRFFAHVAPLACAVAATAFSALSSPRVSGRRVTAAAAALLAVQAVASHVTQQSYRAFVAHRTSVVGAAAGRWFAAHLDPGSLMAVNTVGALPWTSRLPTVDMLGLTDAAIARRPIYVTSAGWAGHRRGWGAYVIGRRPAAILWYNSAGSATPFYLGDRELADNPWFRFFYRHRVERLPALGSREAAGPQPAADPEAPGPDPGEGEPGSTPSPPGRTIERFLGYPFGFNQAGVSWSPDLGERARFHSRPVPWTSFEEAPIEIHWFERDPRDEDLWPLEEKDKGDVAGFIRDVAARWASEHRQETPFDAAARAEVDRLCGEALQAVRAGRMRLAKETLSRAAAIDGAARSPLVYQYMANVAVLTGDLLAAIPAEEEALRLEPTNRLYAANLVRLLTTPWEEATKPQPGTSRRAPGERP